MDRQHCWRLGSGDAEGDVLFDVVPQHKACHFIGHLRQQPTSILVGERAREDDAAEQDLMLTSWSEVSTPAELSIASVLIRPPYHPPQPGRTRSGRADSSPGCHPPQ